MTGTIKLITILLLMVIQHGGDDVSCKRSINVPWSSYACIKELCLHYISGSPTG